MATQISFTDLTDRFCPIVMTATRLFQRSGTRIVLDPQV